MWPGMMPILISSGVMTPGQLGPTSLVLLPCILYLVRIMSRTGMPSVMQITRSRPASTASSVAAAAIDEAVEGDLDLVICITESSVEHTSELQPPMYLACRLLLEKKQRGQRAQ